MGSLFSTPKVPAPAPLSAGPADTSAEEAAARLREIARKRRGRAGTVVTSPAGLRFTTPAEAQAFGARRSLLALKSRLGE